MKKLNPLVYLMCVMVLVLAACGTSQSGTGVPGSTEQFGTQAPSSTEALGTTSPSTTESAVTEAPTTTEAATTAAPEATMPATTEESTPAATQATTESVQATQPVSGTAVIPSTGAVDPDRVSNLMDFSVWDKNNQQIFESAPSFTADQFPDTQTPNWDAQIKTYWQQYISSSSQ